MVLGRKISSTDNLIVGGNAKFPLPPFILHNFLQGVKEDQFGESKVIRTTISLQVFDSSFFLTFMQHFEIFLSQFFLVS